MPEVHVVPEVPGRDVRQHRTPLFWLPLPLLTVMVLIAVPLGMLAQGGGRGGAGGGRGAAPAAGAPAVPSAPPVPGGPAAAAPAGQGRGGQGGAPAGAGARGAAPVDVTGYWVSLVTEDYIERMFPDSPPSGTGRGGRGGRGGAPAAAGTPDPCRVYGAAGSMRLPGRLNISWADDNTLKIEMDSGKQTRLFHFGVTQPPSAEKSLQGYSIATWEAGAGGRGGAGRGGGGGGGGAAPAARWGSLNVVTTNMTGGYLLTSRSAYSENATLTEYFSRHSDFGADYMTVVAIITDPAGNHTTSSTFKKEPNGSKFSPTGCDIVK
jgi:hypothetical protein